MSVRFRQGSFDAGAWNSYVEAALKGGKTPDDAIAAADQALAAYRERHGLGGEVDDSRPTLERRGV